MIFQCVQVWIVAPYGTPCQRPFKYLKSYLSLQESHSDQNKHRSYEELLVACFHVTLMDKIQNDFNIEIYFLQEIQKLSW